MSRLLAEQPITIERRASGAFNADGVYSAASPTTLTIQGSLQSVSGKDLRALPEGRRAANPRYKLFTRDALIPGEAGQAPGDVAVIGGLRFDLIEALTQALPGSSAGFHRYLLVARPADVSGGGVP